MLIQKFVRNLEEASSQYPIQQIFTKLCRVPGTGLGPRDTEMNDQSRVSGEEVNKPADVGRAARARMQRQKEDCRDAGARKVPKASQGSGWQRCDL